MAKKKSAPALIEPEDISQEVPEPTPDPAAKGRPKGAAKGAVSKAEAVRQALAAGMDSPTDGTSFIKSHYGIDMASQAFSSYKAQEKARDAKKTGGVPKGKPGRKPKTSVAQLEAVVKTIQPAMGGSVISDLAAIKSLVAKLGADEVKKIADLFV